MFLYAAKGANEKEINPVKKNILPDSGGVLWFCQNGEKKKGF